VQRFQVVQAGLPFGLTQRGAGHHEAVFGARGVFVHGEADAGFTRNRQEHTVHAFLRHAGLQPLARRAASGAQRGALAAHAGQHARHVDAAAAGVVQRVGAAQFVGGHHALGLG
jgi:hypothetical protein